MRAYSRSLLALKSGKRLGSVQADRKKETLLGVYKQFAKTEAERQRIYLRAMKIESWMTAAVNP